MSILREYMDGWLEGDVSRIAALVAEDAVVIECYGPVYRGRDRIEQWAQTWFDVGGVVHRWESTSTLVAGDHEVIEWVFECTFAGNRSTFEGASIARTRDRFIQELREYSTTEPLYNWTGTWR